MIFPTESRLFSLFAYVIIILAIIGSFVILCAHFTQYS
jgi:hypothetical protein